MSMGPPRCARPDALLDSGEKRSSIPGAGQDKLRLGIAPWFSSGSLAFAPARGFLGPNPYLRPDTNARRCFTDHHLGKDQ
jgi:hypothetical protein